MENWTKFFASCSPPKDMPQFHDHYPSPFYYSFDDDQLAEVDYSFFNASYDDILVLENAAAATEEVCKTTQFSSASKNDQSKNNNNNNNNNNNISPAPMISFLGNNNPTALLEEPTIDFNALVVDSDSAQRIRRGGGAVVSSPETDQSAPPHHGQAVAARNLWTLHEHKLFLVGMQIYGKGKWRNIAKKVVMTKTTSQVASHAQKYFLRQHSAGQKRKRSRLSIHDITTVDPELLLQVLAGQQPPLPPPPSPLPPILPHHTQQCQPSNDSVLFIQPPPQPVALPQQFGAPGDQYI